MHDRFKIQPGHFLTKWGIFPGRPFACSLSLIKRLDIVEKVLSDMLTFSTSHLIFSQILNISSYESRHIMVLMCTSLHEEYKTIINTLPQ